MTINIALATYDGIILGCDSLSSIVEHAIFPFRDGSQWAKGESEELLADKEGMPYVSVQNAFPIATTVFGGVNKIFCLYADEDTVVAALTAGLATLQGITISEQAKRYKRKNESEAKSFSSVEEVAKDFLAFMRERWEAAYGETPDEQKHFLPTLSFIVAGYGKDEEYGKIFRLDVSADAVHEQFHEGDHMGICWAGQADQVERLIRGIDRGAELSASRHMAEAISRQRETTLDDISKSLIKANIQLPEHLELDITEVTMPTPPWDAFQADIDYGNLSNQYAVELVEMLVNTQSGMQRFCRGIPVVGGRTHIGVLKRGEGFQLLNAPQLSHKHTGYGDEL